MSLNGTLATAASSLNLFSLGIQVSGNNIANANTPGYVRSHLEIASSPPYRLGNLLIGTGAYAAGIHQDVDQHLDSRIQAANGDFFLSNALGDAYKQLEDALQSLGDNNISANIGQFVGSLQAVVNQPENTALRAVTIDQAQSFADNIRLLRTRIGQLQEAQTQKITETVEQANQLIDTIQKLNPQISEIEANGLAANDAGALRSQRSEALNQLSQLIAIRTQERPDGGVEVFSGSDFLILGGSSQKLETVPVSANGVITLHVQTSATHAQLNGSGGQLSGLIEGHDTVIQGFSDQLDRFTATVISELNRIHASGEGTKGFTSVTGTNAVADSSAALNAAGLAFSPQNGSFNIKVRNLGTGLTQTSNISVNLDGIGADTSLTSLQTALNAVGQVTATITANGKLQLTAAPGYEIRFGDDTCGTLAALGINTLFTGSNAADIQVNSVLKNDASFLATGQGGGPSDNRNAVQLASAFDVSVGSLNHLTISQFWNQVTAGVGESKAAQDAVGEGLQGFRDALTTQQAQLTGVNLDEELIRILQFQHSYQAAARIVSTVELLMNTLLQI